MSLFIFDVDGVVETEEELFRGRRQKQFEKIMERHDCSLEEAKEKFNEAQKSLPPGKSVSTAYIFEALGFTREEYFSAVNEVDPEGIVEEYPHCCEVLAELSKEHTMVTFSNTPHKALLKTLDVVGATKYFNHIYSAEDFKESKPNPAVLEHIMEEQGFAKEDVIVMGDSLEKDVLPALQLGLQAFLFDPSGKNDVSKHPEVVVLKDWQELL